VLKIVIKDKNCINNKFAFVREYEMLHCCVPEYGTSKKYIHCVSVYKATPADITKTFQ
jgi:hypothetical protein